PRSAPAPTFWLQSAGHWTDPAEIVEEMSAAGYSRARAFDFLPAQIFSPAVSYADSSTLEKGSLRSPVEQGS
ncbi:MAG: hypothetical protein GY910_00645, partial [bacterium]|nr:hypothetical protein [bacterium]